MASTAPKKRHRSSQSQPSHYTLLVELVDSEPTIWRRIHIDGRARLDAFHHVLQAATAWSDAHLHEFEIRDKVYGTPDPDFADEDVRPAKYQENTCPEMVGQRTVLNGMGLKSLSGNYE